MVYIPAAKEEVDKFDFYKEFGNPRVLEREEERQLIIKSQNGDKDALNTLCRHNFGIVFKVAHNMGLFRSSKCRSRKDMIFQYGMLGLTKAINKFEHDRGLKLSTYATHWIRQQLTRAACQGELDGTLTMPNHIGSIIHNLRVQMGHEGIIDPRDVKDPYKLYLDYCERRENKIKFPESAVLDAYHVLCTNGLISSYDGFTYANEEGIDDSHFLDRNDMGVPSPEEEMVSKQRQDSVHEYIDTLDEREKTIIKMRFGIGMQTTHTLEECGEVFGLTRERIRQIETKALRKLKFRAMNGETEKQRKRREFMLSILGK